MKIVILDRTGADFTLEKKIFRAEGASFLVTYFRTAEELRPFVSDADILLCDDIPITADIIATLNSCKLILRYGTDCGTIDLAAAGKKGIFVCNTPSFATYDIAEHTLALLLSACKKIPLADRLARQNNWNPGRIGNLRRLSGKTLGLVGFGPVARKVASRALAFDMNLIVFDPDASLTALEAAGTVPVTLPQLLSESDYISLHMPLTSETHHMMGMEQFKCMKKDAILISAEHGGLIHESELVFALLSGEIGGAALDVFSTIPLSPKSQLLEMENVILTPHIAANSAEGTDALHDEAMENVVRVLHGERPVHIVNQAFLSGHLL